MSGAPPDAVLPDAVLPDDLAIRVTGASKHFRLYNERSRSLLATLTGFHRTGHRDFTALSDVEFDVPSGSMLGIIGHNGSGKSTLLRLLAGVYRPSSGSVAVRGRIAPLLELGGGFHNELTGIDNIFLNGAVHGLDRDYVDTVVDDIVAMADIGDFIESPIEVYSSGMRARLAFAVSVHLQPDVLLADEITSVGDVAFAQKCMDHFDSMREQGVTIVLVSHNLSLVERMSDQVLWMDHGVMKHLGDPQDVINEYREAMAAGYFGDDSPALATAELEVRGPTGDEFGYTGEPLDIRVAYELDRAVGSGQVRVRLQHQSGPLPIHHVTDITPTSPLPASGELHCHIDQLPLAPGHYGVVVHVIDDEAKPEDEHTFARIEDEDPEAHVVEPVHVFEARTTVRVRPQRNFRRGQAMTLNAEVAIRPN